MDLFHHIKHSAGTVHRVTVLNEHHLFSSLATSPHLLPVPLSYISGSPCHFLPFLLCLPSTEAFNSVGLKLGARVLSLKANICHRIFRKSLGSCWPGYGESYPETCPSPCLPHARQVALLQAVASPDDWELHQSGTQLDVSLKSSVTSRWPLKQPVQTCRWQGSLL